MILSYLFKEVKDKRLIDLSISFLKNILFNFRNSL